MENQWRSYRVRVVQLLGAVEWEGHQSRSQNEYFK